MEVRMDKTPEMSIDEFLKTHGGGVFLATVELVDDKPEQCKLTPWAEGRGCLCSQALIIPRAAIASVKPTEHRHFCCGKVLVVVEVIFKEGSTIPIREIWSQLSAVAGRLPHFRETYHSSSGGETAAIAFPEASASTPHLGFIKKKTAAV
jgi:hypothetical protein